MSAGTSDEYLYDSGSDLGQEQLDCLAGLLDHLTMENLGPLIRPGDRCLEIGAGKGTVARAMLERAGPSGRVVAIDLDTSRMEPVPGIELRKHDIIEGVPEGGPFDVIHARLVLMHLSRRREIVSALVDALAPGGRLVIGEFLGPPLEVVESPSPADTELFHRVVDTAFEEVSRIGALSTTWAAEVDACLRQEGLTAVESRRYGQTTAGGTAGCILFRNYIRQLEPLMLAAGLSEAELHRYYRLMGDPAFRVWFFDLMVTTGRRRAGG
ncbi:class I SAM-dependent methyltransferase [Streptomyces triticagri]|uniref:Class I SAM-dependent methyltransferase n=1 Tax=Streptomyces triticagri TaxID=2293568 RepID=A0A372M6G0_9ACTN|nr:class I SAM-dependent methyltransferase [Streptomyces triticagri]RFU86125.1 class I SAM-dependent methyltransferase [Streptomyces triticagri]